MSNKSGVSEQVISLPKGGGALKGIGEKFSPDLHTGTGNFTVPIALPPGRNGLQPQLSLGYSTGNGNGAFGLGWSLSVPGISRQTSKGVPRYEDSTDVFVLSGTEDLVPVEPLAAKTRYRPRTEGLFARIHHHRNANNDYWEVKSKDGLVSLYGTPGKSGDDPGVVVDPDFLEPTKRTKVFAWKLTRTTDPFGNRIEYEYERDLGQDRFHSGNQLYLSEIRYVDYGDPDNPQFLVTVGFVYEDRPDPFSEYRAGFEIRTRKRCERIEVWTHAGQERLVRSYDLIYQDQTPGEEHLVPPNGVSLLRRVRVVGHDGADTQELPPLEFGYTAFEPERKRYQPFSAVGDYVPDRSLAQAEYELVDLFGNGLPSVIQMNGTTRYWRNLGGGVFDLPRTMKNAPPAAHLQDPGVQLADMNGDGRADLLVTDGVRGGYYPLTFEGEWHRGGFVPYRQSPTVNLEDPETKLVDLDGDGVVDALRTGTSLELYYNDGRDGGGGWDRMELRPRKHDLDEFPDVVFSDQRVKLADMSGDGLQDIVLVHDGRIDYWPYQGYGRWGRRIIMSGSPHFEDGARYGGIGYDPKRVLLGDVDGDGLADLVYVGSGHVTVWINRSGNGWSAPIKIHGTPTITDADAVRLADMRGTGTSGILWTYDYGAQRESTYKFLDLTGGIKPYLLNEMDNHIGAVTRVEYVSSTRFYREDQKRPETPWRTPLPFPVQVVARVEAIDDLSKGKLTTEYRYHHGYWDGFEREFRGFGMVEQLDTQSFERYNTPGLHGDAVGFVGFEEDWAQHFSSPTLTKTWFHQGPVDEGFGQWREPEGFDEEFWQGDPQVLPSLFAGAGQPEGLVGRARWDALRALRGRTLRTELYALDGAKGSDGVDLQQRPYTVTEHLYGVREEPPPDPDGADRSRVFFPHGLAQRTTQWERGDDPLVRFTFTDEYDEYGQLLRQTGAALPRRSATRRKVVSAVVGAVDVDETRILATHTRTEYAVPDADLYLRDRVAQARTFELEAPPSVAESAPDDLSRVSKDQASAAGRIHHRFGELLKTWRKGEPLPDSARLIGHTLNHYDGGAFTGRGAGEVGPYGALTRSESLVFTGSGLDAVYGDRRPAYLGGDAALPAGAPQGFGTNLGYRFEDASPRGYHRGYYADTQRRRFDFQNGASGQRRGLVLAAQDARGHEITVEPDDYWLLPKTVRDPVGLETTAEHDYRVMQPSRVTDPNGNSTHLRYTPLGLPRKLFLQGRDGEGGTEEKPETEFCYDFFAYARTREEEGIPQPIFAHTWRRVRHASESASDETIESREYSDGFGRLIQQRSQAEEIVFGETGDDVGLSPEPGGASGPAEGERVVDRVAVSGWQTYDNKGRVIEKYEPFFSEGWEYKPPTEAQLGQKATMFYDPRGQLVRTVNPDGSEQRVVFGIPPDLEDPENHSPTPWESYAYDPNDLAPQSRHPDGSPLTDAAPVAHHHTPASTIIDALGRTVCQVDRNGKDAARDWYLTRSRYDVRGNLLAVTDALDRPAFGYAYDLLNRSLRTRNIDAGLRTSVLDAAGNLVEYRDRKGSVALRRYDALNRPTHLWARDTADERLTLRERLQYGDGSDKDQPRAEREANREANRLGRLHRHHDEAGLLVHDRYDFKGNLSEKARQVIRDAILDGRWTANWGAPGSDGDLAARLYQTSARYDALDRPVEIVYPATVNDRRPMLTPRYNRAGDLESVDLDGAPYVALIAYNARGQRVLAAFGNSVMTRHAYDPKTFRLLRMRSERYTKVGDTYQPQPSSNGEERKRNLLQDFAYGYDLVGNLLALRDRTPDSGLATKPNELNRIFVYDPLYRLLSATGRECDVSPPPPWNDEPRCTDVKKTQGYTQAYQYDPAGNLTRLRHQAAKGAFTRSIALVPNSNRLAQMTVDNASHTYAYDLNGNFVREDVSRHFGWDHADRMRGYRTQTGNAASSVDARYLYDSGGQRVKKLVRKKRQVEATVYVDGLFEHHWVSRGNSTQENNTLHLMDNQSRIALVRVGRPFPVDRTPAVKYQLGDHLGSSNVMIDDAGSFVNREEYTPYGETSFGSFARKRYRFTGKERDEESGLYYHGARYYAPWLGRWTSCDPIGLADGVNVYAYTGCNPCTRVDPSGTTGEPPQLHLIQQSELRQPVTATATTPGITQDLRRTYQNLGAQWGWEKTDVGHPENMPFARTPAGTTTSVYPQESSENRSLGASQEKAGVAEARKNNQFTREGGVDLTAQKGTRFGQPARLEKLKDVAGPSLRSPRQLELPLDPRPKASVVPEQLELPLTKPAVETPASKVAGNLSQAGSGVKGHVASLLNKGRSAAGALKEGVKSLIPGADIYDHFKAVGGGSALLGVRAAAAYQWSQITVAAAQAAPYVEKAGEVLGTIGSRLTAPLIIFVDPRLTNPGTVSNPYGYRYEGA